MARRALRVLGQQTDCPFLRGVELGRRRAQRGQRASHWSEAFTMQID